MRFTGFLRALFKRLDGVVVCLWQHVSHIEIILPQYINWWSSIPTLSHERITITETKCNNIVTELADVVLLKVLIYIKAMLNISIPFVGEKYTVVDLCKNVFTNNPLVYVTWDNEEKVIFSDSGRQKQGAWLPKDKPYLKYLCNGKETRLKFIT